MFRDAHVTVVVPAYNESRLVARTVRSVPPWIDRVVVVDDGSQDDTAAQAQACGPERVRVVRHDRNRGVGAAIVTGYRAAFEEGTDVAVVMAGDAQMDPSDLEALLEPLVEGRADYVKGDRLSWPNARRHMPVSRWIGNRVLALLTRFATGMRVRDSQCGYTAIGRRAAARLPLDRLWPRYGYPNDLLGALAAARLRVTEVTVRPVYRDEDSGIRVRHALFVVPWVLARIVARRVLGRVGTLVSGAKVSEPYVPDAETSPGAELVR